MKIVVLIEQAPGTKADVESSGPRLRLASAVSRFWGSLALLASSRLAQIMTPNISPPEQCKHNNCDADSNSTSIEQRCNTTTSIRHIDNSTTNNQYCQWHILPPSPQLALRSDPFQPTPLSKFNLLPPIIRLQTPTLVHNRALLLRQNHIPANPARQTPLPARSSTIMAIPRIRRNRAEGS